MASNLLISGLPAAERTRLAPILHPVRLADGQPLVEPDRPIRSLYFSEDAVLYTSQPLPGGRSIPAGLTGHDGVAGFELWLGRDRSPLRTVAEVGGHALEMNADDLGKHVLGTPSALNTALADYVFYFTTMGAQMATCLHSHAPEERLCRWLQMITKRLPERDEFSISASFIASLLQSEPHTATLAVRVLERAGLITYQRQKLRIMDRQGLHDGCCECLSIFQDRLLRLLGDAPQA